MSAETAVFDAGSVIAFHQLDRLDLLNELFARSVVPHVVAQEVAPSLGAMPNWLELRPIEEVPTFLRGLGAGERAAIALALGLIADVIVVDDRRARRAAERLGLVVIGSLCLLVSAKGHGLIAKVQPLMDAMVSDDFFVGEKLHHEILAIAGETDR
jgi:uncharacterized protein